MALVLSRRLRAVRKHMTEGLHIDVCHGRKLLHAMSCMLSPPTEREFRAVRCRRVGLAAGPRVHPSTDKQHVNRRAIIRPCAMRHLRQSTSVGGWVVISADSKQHAVIAVSVQSAKWFDVHSLEI
jgi:hypothetical protein